MTKKAINPKKFPELPDKLKQARSQKGLTQGQLSKKTGVDIQRLSKYDRSFWDKPSESSQVVVKTVS
jgi:transcriptional regulator with XRE-family HTH domain